MKSLFLRIFIWLWLAMAVLAMVLVVSSPFFTRSRPRLEQWQKNAEGIVRGHLERAVRGVEAGRTEAPDGREDGRRHHIPLEVFVFDSEGREIRGREAPRAVSDMAARAAERGGEDVERRGGLYLMARPANDPDGRQLVVVAALHRPPTLVDLIEPGALAIRLGATMLVMGALSFWLARYLSAPVRSLRRATQQLSSGDLSARVGGPVNRRRDEIGGLARDFDAMAERLEALLAGQRRLLRDVSHELRSPLARLVVALELARDRAGAKAGDSLDRIGREAERMDGLIGQLLLLERLEAGRPGERENAFDLGEVLAEVVEDAAFEARSRGRQVVIEACPTCPMKGHPDLLRSAFDNVLRNAVRHTGKGTTVAVSLAVANGVAEVIVRDRGPGVPVDDLGVIFEPFSRIAEARERATGGAGLGLAITKRAIEIHGGSVSADNLEEGGLEVLMRLPIRI
jgi:two-component system sensor histidine kinase CpxA